MGPFRADASSDVRFLRWDGFLGFVIKVGLIASAVMLSAIRMYGLATTKQIDDANARIDTAAANISAIRSDLNQLKLMGCIQLSTDQKRVVGICQ